MKKKEKDKISIIVPVYNTEKYLDRCIESLVKQSYKNLEIIVIDDGSTDCSMDVCKKWEKEDSRIIVFHKENGGTASARNFGLEKATGDFIGFVDSDDYVSLDMYENLYKGCIDNSVNVAMTGISRNGQSNNHTTPKLISTIEAISLMLVDGFSCCNKLYKHDLFDDVCFPENNSFEDIITVPYLVIPCKKIYFDGKSSYFYVQNVNSKVHASFNIKKMDYFYNTEKMNDYICKQFPCLENECAANYCLVCTTLLNDVYPEKKKYKKEYEFLTEKLKNKYFSMSDKKIIPFYKRIMIVLSIYKKNAIVILIKKILKK